MCTSIYQSIPVEILKEGTKRNVPGSSECMKYEFFRLSSFVSFPQTSGGRPLKLAKAGFLFTPRHLEDDTVTCFSCQTTKNNWMRYEEPMKIHKSLNPDCEFIKGNSDNVEIHVPKDDVCQMIKSKLREKYGEEIDEATEKVPQVPRRQNLPQTNRGSSLKSSSPSRHDPVITLTNYRPQLTINVATDPPDRKLINDPTKNYPENNTNKGNNNIVHGKETTTTTQTASFPNQAILATRLGSFSNWPRGNLPPSKEVLAEAGFFYTGREDAVKCFFCGVCLKFWEKSDVPWQEHARWFPECPYLVRVKGQNFINTYRKPDHGTAQTSGRGKRSPDDDHVNLQDGKRWRSDTEEYTSEVSHIDQCQGLDPSEDSNIDHCQGLDSSEDSDIDDFPGHDRIEQSVRHNSREQQARFYYGNTDQLSRSSSEDLEASDKQEISCCSVSDDDTDLAEE